VGRWQVRLVRANKADYHHLACPPSQVSSHLLSQLQVCQAERCSRGISLPGDTQGLGGGSPLDRGCGSCEAVQASHEGCLKRTWDARGPLKKSAGWGDGRGWLPAAANEPLELMSTQQRSGHLEGS